MGIYKKKYLANYHSFAPGYNHETIMQRYGGTYSVIDITIKNPDGVILENWDILTCDVVYECERCYAKGGIEIDDIIHLAERNNGQLKDEFVFCDNEKCNNRWDIDVRLMRKD